MSDAPRILTPVVYYDGPVSFSVNVDQDLRPTFDGLAEDSPAEPAQTELPLNGPDEPDNGNPTSVTTPAGDVTNGEVPPPEQRKASVAKP
jgi:hypothetical protein